MTSKKSTKNDGEPRQALHVDEDVKASAMNRLKRIEGQVRGVQKMVEEQRYCGDILVQLSAVQEALRTVSRELLRNHLKHCATHAFKQGEESAEAMYDELVELFHKHAR